MPETLDKRLDAVPNTLTVTIARDYCLYLATLRVVASPHTEYLDLVAEKFTNWSCFHSLTRELQEPRNLKKVH